ncbi:Actin-depolymerizing factor gmf1 [Penicillium rolfsii]|nr:Actin-depolymerizing factor gmf1 [Penicillium rolfsii]
MPGLYSFSPETKEKLRKFRLSSSRAKEPQAQIYEIDKNTGEIRPKNDETYSNMMDLADELPETTPQFIVLSHPLTLWCVLSQKDGRLSVPYVLLYYKPENCKTDTMYQYANAVELMRTTAGVNRLIPVESEDDVISIATKLAGDE